MEESKGKILGRSALYVDVIMKLSGGEEIISRHEALEKLIAWPDVALSSDGKSKALAMLKQQGFRCGKGILDQDLQLYSVVSEALEYGKKGRQNFLAEKKEHHQDKVPVLGCSFRTLEKIISEIEKSFEKSSYAAEAAALQANPQASAPDGALPIEPKRGRKKPIDQQTKDELQAAKALANQQALQLLELNQELAVAMKEIMSAAGKEAELAAKLAEKETQRASLIEENAKLRRRNRELSDQWTANVAVLDRARKINMLFEELEEYIAELKKPLEIVEAISAEETASSGKLLDVVNKIPKKMETNGQDLEPGPGLAASLDSLDLSNEERKEVLDAIILFSKVGGNRECFATSKFGRKGERPSSKLSLTSSKKLGFVWNGGRIGVSPTIIYEVIRLKA